jgi:hypothetical protein
MLLRGAPRDEEVREELAEGRVFATPADADEVDERLGLQALGVIAGPRAATLRIGIEEDELRDALRVPDREVDRQRTALRDAEQNEPVFPDSVPCRVSVHTWRTLYG